MTIFLKKNSVLLHKFFKSCADSTIKLFLPIIIYKQTQSLMLTFLYLSVYYFIWGILTLSLKPAIRSKPVLLVVLHFIPWVAVLAYVTFLPINIVGIFVLATLAALAGAMYSSAINIIFTINPKTNNIAKFQAASVAGKIFFTILTAYLIGSSFKNSFLLLLIIGTGLYLLSSFFVAFNRVETNKLLENLPVKKTVESIKLNRKFNVLNMFFGMFQGVVETILPLYLYYYSFTIQQVTYVIVLSEIVKIAAGFLAKHLHSKQKDKLLILFSGLVYAVFISLVPFVKNAWFYYAVSIVLPVTFPLIHVTIFSKYIDHLKTNEDLIAGQITRDFFILVPRGLGYPLFFLASSFTPIFFLGALSAIGIIVNNYLIKPQKKVVQVSKTELETTELETIELEINEEQKS